MGTGSEQIPAGIAGKTVAARCLSPFFTVLGIHRPKMGTGTVGKPKNSRNNQVVTEPVPVLGLPAYRLILNMGRLDQL